MAKTENGILDGFIGKVGTVVGYKWNGKSCMRAYVKNARNPRTEKQVAHRELFKQEVQLAAKMRWAVAVTLRDLAREAGMTAYNLFVKANQGAFSSEGGRLQVDYSALRLSFGDVPPVEEASASWTADNVLKVNFRRGRGASTDYVYLYVYVPELGEGFLSAPVYRNEKRISVLLPEKYAGHEAQLYLMVQHLGGNWSNSEYIGSLPLSEMVGDEEIVIAEGVDKEGEWPVASGQWPADGKVMNEGDAAHSSGSPHP